MKKVTMTQIAKEMGISRTLVSYAIYDKYGVSEETKRKIIIKAIEMGFYRSQKFIGLNRKKLAIVIDEEFASNDNFFSRIVEGIEYYAYNNSWDPKIISLAKDEEVGVLVSKIVGIKPIGIIVIRSIKPKFVEMLQKIDVPKVYVDLIEPLSNCFEVRINNFRNSYDSVVYLAKQQGFKKITFVGDILWAVSFNERYCGFLLACERNGVFHTDIIGRDKNGQNCFDEEAFVNHIKMHDKEAIVCANDSIADRVYQILKEEGKQIPENFAIMGFDDEEFCKVLSPQLTTMHIPRFELGIAACELLSDQMEKQEMVCKTVLLNAQLVERGSV